MIYNMTILYILYRTNTAEREPMIRVLVIMPIYCCTGCAHMVTFETIILYITIIMF